MGSPRTASVVAYGEWVCTIAPTSGRSVYTRQCSGVSEDGLRSPLTTEPSRRMSTMSDGSIRSYSIDDGVISTWSPGRRMLRFPLVWLSRPRASRSRPQATSCFRAAWSADSVPSAAPVSLAAGSAGMGGLLPALEQRHRPGGVDRFVGADRQRSGRAVGHGLVGGQGDLQGPAAVRAERPERAALAGDRVHEIGEDRRGEL